MNHHSSFAISLTIISLTNHSNMTWSKRETCQKRHCNNWKRQYINTALQTWMPMVRNENQFSCKQNYRGQQCCCELSDCNISSLLYKVPLDWLINYTWCTLFKQLKINFRINLRDIENGSFVKSKYPLASYEHTVWNANIASSYAPSGLVMYFFC